jgi:hypothetical protein
MIKAGHVSTIRFWASLFNLYRIIQIPGVVKLQTITNVYTGDLGALERYRTMALSWDYFESVTDLKLSLVPKNFVVSRAASPSNKLSVQGILTDV